MNLPPVTHLAEPVGLGPEGRERDVRDILNILSAGRWTIALTTLLFLVAGLLYLWIATPIYKSDALLQVEYKQKTINAALGDVAELLGVQAPVTAEIEIVRSRMVAEKVVDTLGLDISTTPHYFPIIGRAIARRWRGEEPAASPAFFSRLAGMLGLSGLAWGGEKLRISTLEVPAALLGRPLPLVVTAQGFQLQADSTLVTGVPGELARAETPHGPLSIFVTEIVARPGTMFTVIRHWRPDVVSTLQRGVRVIEKGRQSGVLGVTFEGVDRELVARVVHEIVTAYQRQNVERRSAEAAQTLLFLEEQLPLLRTKLEAAEAELNRYRLQRGSADLTKETELILQQSVELEKGRLELAQKRQELMQRFRGEHPALRAVDAQLAQITQSQGEITSLVKTLPDTQQELLRLARDVQVNTALYTSLLNSAQELQVVKAGMVGNVRIIDFPQVATRPARPLAPLTLGMAFIAGLLGGIVLVFLLQALRHGVFDPAEVERALGLPTYAAIPRSSEQLRIASQIQRKKSAQVLAVAHPDSIAAETFRSLRTALHFSLIDAPNNVIMLTGPTPSVGKSFVTANLGAILASAGKHVLIVDADLRRGHMNEYLGLPRAPGLSDFIAGDAHLEVVLQRTPIDNLSVITSGTIPPNPAELLLHERVAVLFQVARTQFDHILVDTPPVLAVTDAAIIGKHAGTTLLVLKAGEHPLRAIEDSVRRLQQTGIAVRGTIFNQVGAIGKYGYSYETTYRYQGKYRAT